MIESLEDKQYTYLQKINNKLIHKYLILLRKIFHLLLKKLINQQFLMPLLKALEKDMKLSWLNKNSYMQSFKKIPVQLLSPLKKLNRLCARLVEILDYSMLRARQSIVFTNIMQSQHLKFKKDMNLMLITQFLTFIWSHQRHKYQVQIDRIQRYSQKLETGQNIFFRSFYQKDFGQKKEEKISPIRVQNKIRSLKKQPKNSGSKSRQKSKEKQFFQKQPDQISLKSHKSQSKKQLKNKNAYKLLKHYNILELSKKQFLEDMVFEQEAQHQQKRKMFYNLWQKNKVNKDQIKQFASKVNSVPNINKILIQRAQKFPKPMDTQVTNQGLRDSSLNLSGSSKIPVITQRNNFIISRVRHKRDLSNNSIHLKTPRQQFISDIQIDLFKHEQHQALIVPQLNFNQQIKKQEKKIQSEDKKPFKSMTPKTKRIYVVKSPVIFQDQALINQPQIKPKKYQPPRFKRRNYQYPLDKSQISKRTSHLYQFPV